MRILVSAASKHGATAEISTALAHDLREAGLDADVTRPDDVETLEPYAAVVLGSGIYVGQWLPEAKAFVERHREALTRLPVWLFSSGPIGSPDPKPAGDPEGVRPILAELTPRGHRVFAGSLDRGRLSFGEKAITMAVRAPSGDFRDWESIAAWAREIARDLAEQRALASR